MGSSHYTINHFITSSIRKSIRGFCNRFIARKQHSTPGKLSIPSYHHIQPFYLTRTTSRQYDNMARNKQLSPNDLSARKTEAKRFLRNLQFIDPEILKCAVKKIKALGHWDDHVGSTPLAKHIHKLIDSIHQANSQEDNEDNYADSGTLAFLMLQLCAMFDDNSCLSSIKQHISRNIYRIGWSEIDETWLGEQFLPEFNDFIASTPRQWDFMAPIASTTSNRTSALRLPIGYIGLSEVDDVRRMIRLCAAFNMQTPAPPPAKRARLAQPTTTQVTQLSDAAPSRFVDSFSSSIQPTTLQTTNAGNIFARSPSAITTAPSAAQTARPPSVSDSLSSTSRSSTTRATPRQPSFLHERTLLASSVAGYSDNPAVAYSIPPQTQQRRAVPRLRRNVVEDQLQRLRREKAQVETEKAQLETEKAQVKTEISALKARVADLETQVIVHVSAAQAALPHLRQMMTTLDSSTENHRLLNEIIIFIQNLGHQWSTGPA